MLGAPVMRHAFLLVIAALLTEAAMSAGSPNAPDWMTSLVVPEFSPPKDAADWPALRSETRKTLTRLLGDFPARPAVPLVTLISKTEGDGYVLEKFTFKDGLGLEVPGYLFLPNLRMGKIPGILYCHWHAGQWAVGKEEMLRTNATPVAPGPALARRGFAVLGIDACCFGERNGKGPGGDETGVAGELSASKFSLWAGRTLWGTILYDDLMALDYLCSRSEVDPTRIGVTGISMGSTRSWWIMAMDDRPKTAVCVACMTRYQDLVRAGGLKEHGIYYFVPGMLRHFDTEAVISCAAPRPMLFLTGDSDPGSPISGVHALEERVSQVYAKLGAQGSFSSVVYPNTGHVYLPMMWDKMADWMEEKLQAGQ
jgi:dienelactone hydrolase